MKILRLLGFLITIFSFYFIFNAVKKLDLIGYINLISPLSTFFLCLLVLIFSITVLILSFAWKLILEFISKKKVKMRDVFSIYAKANIGKYLPGNFMHFANRNLIGEKLQLKHSEIALSSLIEVGFMVISTCILLLVLSFNLTFNFIKDKINILLAHKVYLITIVCSIVVFLLLLVFFYLKYIENFRKMLSQLLNEKLIILFIKVFFINTIRFLILGFILIFIFNIILNVRINSFITLLNIQGMFIFSWLAGFITPGSPGGIGVREGLLLLLLSNYFPEETIFIAITLHRLISILGDILAFFVGILLSSKK